MRPPLLDRPPGVPPLVMGVVNVTPDSFSDGGRFLDPRAAVAHGMAMLAQGADLLDVGGESTRPGAGRPDLQEELRRVQPVVAALAREGATVSVDTMRAAVAEHALAAGAAMVNDVSGGLADPGMPALVARAHVPYVVMHWRGHSVDMAAHAQYADVVAEVRDELSARVDALVEAGVDPDLLVLDPGFGFAKDAEHSWTLLRHLDALVDLGHPVLVGTSRKSFLGRVGVAEDQPPRAAEDRDALTAATTVLAAQAGVWAVRVHDVPSTVDALGVVDAVRSGV